VHAKGYNLQVFP